MKVSALVAGSCLGRSGAVGCQMLPIRTAALTGAFCGKSMSGVHDGLPCCSTHLVACMMPPNLDTHGGFSFYLSFPDSLLGLVAESCWVHVTPSEWALNYQIEGETSWDLRSGCTKSAEQEMTSSRQISTGLLSRRLASALVFVQLSIPTEVGWSLDFVSS